MRFLSIAVLCFVLGLGTKVLAASEFRLGLVDIQRAIDSVDEGKAKKEALEKEFKPKGDQFKEKEEKLKKMKEEIDNLQVKEASNLLKGPEVERLRSLKQTFEKQYMEYMQGRQQTEQDAYEKQRKATDEILNKIQDVVKEVGREGSFTLILDKTHSGLIYASDPTELTEKVIQKYNAKFKKK